MKLRELGRRPARLRWDDRLGILGVTAGTEYNVYWLAGLLAGVVGWTLTRRIGPSVVPASVLDIALPAVLGFCFLGGPVFRFLGIEVRRADGRPAGRLRCAWRNVVAWLPMLVSNAWLPVLLVQPDAVAIEPGTEVLLESLFLLLFFMCAASCVMVPALFAVIYGVLRPQRGIPDLLARTCLVPR